MGMRLGIWRKNDTKIEDNMQKKEKDNKSLLLNSKTDISLADYFH